MGSRWIKIYDKFLQWEWFGKAEMVQLFLYLLLRAKHKDDSWQGIPVLKGQVITTNAAIRRDLGLSAQTVRTCLKRLIKTGEITYKSTNRYVVITICKYESYQCQESQINEQSTIKQRAINEQSTSKTQPNQRANNEQKSVVNICVTDSCEDIKETANEQINEQSTSKRNADSAETNNNTRIKNIEDNNKETSLTRGKEKTAAVETAPTSASDEAEAPKPIKAEKRENLPFKEIKDMWNAVCVGYPKLHSLSESRKNKMRNRVAEMGGAEKALLLLREIFTKMQVSNFLRGDNKRGWKASFDWLFENDKNWVKVYEGNYDNRPDTAPRYRTNNSNNGKNCNDEWK